MENNYIDFQKDVIEESKRVPVVVDFWAEWCAPCKMLSPVLEKLAREANGRWRLVKINTEYYPEIAQQFQVSSIPAVKMISQGKVIAEFVGALPEQSIVRWLDENLPTESKKAVQEAVQLLQRGDHKKAVKLLKYALEEDPTNVDARVLLAQLIFEQSPQQAAELVRDFDESYPRFDYAEAIRTLSRLILSYDQLKKQADKEKSEAWQEYIAGIKALKNKDYEHALKAWINTLMLDRQLDDDGARKACVSLFKLLGSEHELTQKYHRQFTSALF